MLEVIAYFVARPPHDPNAVNDLRELNIVVGIFAFFAVLFLRVVPQWNHFDSRRRLVNLALLDLIFSGVYGSIEIVFFPRLYFRVFLVTIALVWAIAAALWPGPRE